MWQCVAGGSGRCNEWAYDAGSPCGSVSLVGVVVVVSVRMMQVLHVTVCRWWEWLL